MCEVTSKFYTACMIYEGIVAPLAVGLFALMSAMGFVLIAVWALRSTTRLIRRLRKGKRNRRRDYL